MYGHSQVIDVPMRPGRRPTVVCDARAYTTRAERTANINIKSGTHVELPKQSNLYQSIGCG